LTPSPLNFHTHNMSPPTYQPSPKYSIQYQLDHEYEEGEYKPLISEGSEKDEKSEKSSLRKELEIIGLMILVIIFGSLNKVANKIMTKPMGKYSFFLALFNGIAYVIVEYGILFVRYNLKWVSRDDMMFPWRRMETEPGSSTKWWDTLWGVKYFILIGLMDGLGTVLSLIPTPYLSGPMLPVMSQTTVFFCLICSVLMLRARYTMYQIGSVFIVVAGTVVSLIPDFLHQDTDDPIGWLLLYAFSMLPGAISFTIKELVFRKRKHLELFIVNSTGSLFQLLFWPATLPFVVLLQQTNGKPLGEYIKNGFECFGGHTPANEGNHCSPDPYPYLVYIGINITFNILLLLLLKRASALQGFMATNAVTPVSVILFLIHWPLIGSSSVSNYTILSLFIVLTGLGLYRYTTVLKERASNEQK